MTAPIRKPAWLAATIVTTLLATGNPVLAQQFKRTELQRHDLTGTNMEVIVATVEAPPGATLPRHFHYGEEAVYVLEGSMIETFEGQRQMSETGSSYINVREVPHGGYKVIGSKPLKVLTIHIVDKGKQMTWPVAHLR
jgi:quercetin dioxygenase-like cupin family protein